MMTMLLENFHFLRPWWLLAIVPACLLAFGLLGSARRSTQWQSYIDARLLPFLLDGETSGMQKAPIIALALLWSLASIALAGPTWQQKAQPVQQDTSAMVILWDLSPSMYAQDVKPSRLVRARLKLMDLLNTRDEGLTALITYSGDAHVVTPLTDDTRTIKSLLPGIDPSVMPSIGSNAEAAFELAHSLLKETGIAEGSIVFVSDGIAADAYERLRATARSANHRVSVWGIGTKAGAPIPLPSGGFVKDKRDEIVIAQVDSDALSDAAASMGGIYIPFSNDSQDIDTLNYFGSDNYAAQTQDKQRVFDQWQEQGHWIALLLLPFAAVAFRRGWLLCLCLGGVLAAPESHALGWQDLWKTEDQQGQELLKKEDFDAAAKNFESREWKGVARYKAGEFDAASEIFAQGDSADDHYNRGNALTQQGEYEQAIAAYEQALSRNPDFAHARDNKAIAEKLKTLQEQQQEGEQGDGDESQDGEQQSGQQQSDQQEQGENSSSQESQGENSSGNQQDPSQANEGDNQGESSEDGSQSDEQHDTAEMNQQQKQALDQHFQQDPEQATESEQTQPQTAQEEQEKQEQQEAEAAQQAQLAEEGEETDSEQNTQSARLQLSKEQQEQQQALEQWLRRVPDDPSGLLRNKFKYEYQKRRRESQSQSQTLRSPNESEEQRW